MSCPAIKILCKCTSSFLWPHYLPNAEMKGVKTHKPSFITKSIHRCPQKMCVNMSHCSLSKSPKFRLFIIYHKICSWNVYKFYQAEISLPTNHMCCSSHRRRCLMQKWMKLDLMTKKFSSLCKKEFTKTFIETAGRLSKSRFALTQLMLRPGNV
jgi:hypothetical protein